VKPGTPRGLRHLDGELEIAAQAGLLRCRVRPTPAARVSFCSNDYLGLAGRPSPPSVCGAGASRLVDGDREVHAELEQASAAWVGQPAALAFSSGYAANLGLLSALAGPGDLIVSDALNHASIVDGARLSRAEVAVVPHLDVGAVEDTLAQRRGRARRAFVVTEAYFSMDADSPDLGRLRRACDAHDATLVVDEAHALGVLGPHGRGLCAEHGIEADALVGTYGKAFGAAGAFVAGCSALVDWLWNRSRSFVFSTGLSPAVASAALQGLDSARAEPQLRESVLSSASRLRDGLQSAGVVARGYGHIVPWVIGDARDAVRVADALREQGIDVRPIRPPSVPSGSARLRLTVTASHRGSDIERAVEAIRRVSRGQAP
jgi:8-amino-7-oxononanoate synthase